MMATKLLLLSLALLLLRHTGVRGVCMDQETAEFDSECRTNFRFAGDHVFPADIGILHDSYDFTSLLSTAPQYRRVDVDGDGASEFTQRGGICMNDLRACSTTLTEQQQNSQNNWVFTSFIRFPSVAGVDGVREMFLNISYRFSECTSRSTCTNDFVTVYAQNANSALPESAQTDHTRYRVLRDTEQLSRLQQMGSSTSTVHWSIPRTRLSMNGFYLAFRDQGTCGQVNRILVYYQRNPAYTGTLLTCPSVPLPLTATPTTTQGVCCCGENANNSSPLTITCSPGGSCVQPASDVCGCAPGYTYNMPSARCDSCPAGTFQPDTSTTSSCEACPENSEALLAATGVCRCTGATVRNPARPQDPCSEPPSSPLLTTKPTVDGTLVTVCWGAALNSGGRDDLHYNVYVRQIGASVYTKANDAPIMGELCYVVDDLNPSSSYTVVVTSANGATQDSDTLDEQLSEVQGRFVAFFVDTGETELPSSPLLTTKPTVDRTFVTVCWGAALNSGGRDDLHYNVYVRQIGAPVYTRANSASITGELCYKVSGLNLSSCYAVVVTSANGATGDGDTLDEQLSQVQGRFVVYFVDTGEAEPPSSPLLTKNPTVNAISRNAGLSEPVAIALTFIITLILAVLITAVIMFFIMWRKYAKNTTLGTSPNGIQLKNISVSSNKAYDNAEGVKSLTRSTP